MRIGTSLILGAVGAIMRFAVEPRSHIAGTFVNWDIVGDILMVAGAVGLLAGILWMAAATRHTSSNTTPREG
ncbi:MAG: DUF6458 family protein [Ktedonobacterales bacterium]